LFTTLTWYQVATGLINY